MRFYLENMENKDHYKEEGNQVLIECPVCKKLVFRNGFKNHVISKSRFEVSVGIDSKHKIYLDGHTKRSEIKSKKKA